MNIRQLRYFLAVAQDLNFTRAAERVGIAQPPLSQQIMALEQELGTPLFTRERRRVELTAAGEVLVEHAKRVINAAAAAVDAVRMSQRGANATLRVGAIYSAIYAFLPRTLRGFAERAPQVEVSLQELTIQQQLAALKEGAIEIGLLRGPIYDRDIKTEILYRERLLLAVPSDSPLSTQGPIRLKDFAELPLIAVARSASRSYSDRVLEVFEAQNVHPRIVHEVSDMHTAVCLVAAGMGVSIVPAIMQTLQTNGVAYCPIETRTPGVTFALAMRRGTSSELTEAFIAAARESAGEMLKTHPDLFVDPE